MLQGNRPQWIQASILDPATSHALQDESCAPTPFNVSNAFNAFNVPNVCEQERGIHAAG